MGEEEHSERVAHWIGQLLNFDFRDSPYLQGMDDDPRQLNELARSYLREYFEALSAIHPVVLLLEDLHWADNSSLDLLSLLPTWLSEQRMLFLCSARPALFERRAEWGQSFPRHTLVSLLPLAEEESRYLVREILQKVQDLPSELEEIVTESAEGNPFYVEELLKMLVEEGVILKGEESWSVAVERLAQARVPPTLTGVIQARFDSLEPEEKVLLQRASVIGRTFWDRAVEQMGKRNDQGQDDVLPSGDNLSLSNVLDRLRRREMVFRRDRSTFENADEYLFKHALMRDVIYESLLKRIRRTLHAAAAGWLVAVTERSHRSEEYAAIIAGHYEAAEAFEQAALWNQRAGEGAAARFANAEAVNFLTRALKFNPEDDVAQRYSILTAREKVYELQGNWQGQAQDLEVMDTLAEMLDHSGGGIGSRVSSHRAEVALRQALLAEWRGDFPMTIACAQRAVSLSTSVGFKEGEIRGNLAWSRALSRQGNYETARAKLEDILTRADEFPKIQASIYRALGIILERQGNYADAVDHYEKALGFFRKLKDRRQESNALNDLGGSYFYQGKYEQAKVYFEAALRTFREIGDLRMVSVTLTNLGSIAYSQGNFTQTRQHFTDALHIDRMTGDRSGECMDMNNLGHVAIEQRDFEAAKTYLESALRLSKEIQEPYNEGMALMNLGLFYLIIGKQDDAETHLQQALKICQTLEDRQGESLTLAYLGMHFNHLGEPERAEKHCQEALRIATEIGARDAQAEILVVLGHAYLGLGEIGKAEMAYQSSLDLRGELGQLHLTPEPRAGLAQICLTQKDLTKAESHVREILALLESKSIDGTNEAAWVYLTCYQVLRQGEHPLANQVLEAGYRLLSDWANGIANEDSRQAFLNNTSGNRALLAAWTSRFNA